MRTCARCKQVKPDSSFRKAARSGELGSHCWHCRRLINQKNRRKYEHRELAERHVRDRIYVDPNAYAYNVARHISTYVGDRIERWERRGTEAHPYLAAIKKLADDLATQALTDAAETAGLAPRHCDWCSIEFQPIHKRQRFCCTKHRQKAADHQAVLTGKNRERMRRRAMLSDTPR